MESVLQKILVIGGNGFIGSAVCKAALAKGMQVTSISSSGRPYQTPKGHTPAWAHKIDWQKADAFAPSTYAHLLEDKSAVVHTLGTLLEDGAYKNAVRNGDVFGLISALAKGIGKEVGFGGGNPLEEKAVGRGSYEALNRDSALRVCEAFLSSSSATSLTTPRTFVYLSAEDTFRPLIPDRYIETKRDAERQIEALVSDRVDFRAIYIRPSLVYHAHLRPLTSPLAVALDLQATLHSKVPPSFPTPAGLFRYLASALPNPSTPSSPSSPALPSPFESVANALTVPPIHVEHVAEAVVKAVERKDVRGVLGVREMRNVIGWREKGEGRGRAASVHV